MLLMVIPHIWFFGTLCFFVCKSSSDFNRRCFCYVGLKSI